MPASEEISEMVQEYDFWVFDDMASELKNNTCFTNFFTKTAHHKNCLMAYLTPYQAYFDNKADCRWICVLGN